MNVIQLLKQDHQEAMSLMQQLQVADKGNNSQSMETFSKLSNALKMHMQFEEQVFYPALKNQEETEDMIPEAYDEHEEAKAILAEMSSLMPNNNSFMDKLSELRDAIEHHVEEEENELFPKAQQVLSEHRLQEMGEQLQQMKQGQSATATNKRM